MTGNPWLQILLAIVGAFGAGGIGAAILNAMIGGDGRRADAAKTLAQTATSTASELVEAVRAELRETRKELADYRAETDVRIDTLEERVTELKRRFWVAVGHIRQQDAILDDIAPDHPRPDVPPELRDYL
jgi:uncharacterized Ntn-hydrolase superfamily protein